MIPRRDRSVFAEIDAEIRESKSESAFYLRNQQGYWPAGTLVRMLPISTPYNHNSRLVATLHGVEPESVSVNVWIFCLSSISRKELQFCNCQCSMLAYKRQHSPSLVGIRVSLYEFDSKPFFVFQTSLEQNGASPRGKRAQHE